MQLGQWIGLLALAIALVILWQIRNVIMLIFAAVVLAAALNATARQIQRFKLHRGLSVFLAIVGILGVFVLSLWLIVPPFADQFQQLTTLFPLGIERVNRWLDDVYTQAPPAIAPYLPDVNGLIPQLQPIANQLVGSSFAFFSGTLGALVNSLLVIVLAIMFIVDPNQYRQAFVRCFPSFYRRRIQEIIDKCDVALQGWLIGILFNMAVIGTFSGLGLWILQIPLPLANGILAGLLTFIPNIGPALSVVPPMAIALIDAPWKSIAVLILYFAVQQLETNLLTPYVMAQQVALIPAVTLLSQVFFATFFGFLGLLLALPLTVVGQVWIQEILVKDILDQWQDGRFWKQPPVTSAHVPTDAEPVPAANPEDPEALIVFQESPVQLSKSDDPV
ncbi:MAG: AI-2E family transporter [Synechococcales bacterium]|nr:AI-2E family transporter [Synechococcales bacterium]